MLKKCTYNSQYIAHYAQVEPTIIMLTKADMCYLRICCSKTCIEHTRRANGVSREREEVREEGVVNNTTTNYEILLPSKIFYAF